MCSLAAKINALNMAGLEDDFVPPSKDLVKEIAKPFNNWFSPKLYGFEKIERERPALYVSNHTVMGLTDGLFLGVEMYLQKDIMLRPLVDHLHWGVPFWRDLIRNVGMVPGTRESCSALMEAGEHILVFPGGRREVCKHKGEAYQLIWRNRTGFARMAIQFGYDIIPVAAIGGEEVFDILLDAKDIMKSPVGAWLHNSGIADRYLQGGENLPPIVKGIGRTIWPKPERHYVMVGDRIDTTRFNGETEDEDLLLGLRGEVEQSFQHMFEDLQAYRNNDKDDEWWRWLLKKM
jgi:1-acyl-sn-glycerol-3-phosphate acyltransferase